VVAAAKAALPTPPVFVADVEATWNQGNSTPTAFDIEISADDTCALTDAEIVGVIQDQHAIASDAVDTVDFANNELDIASHGLVNGDGPIQFTTSGTIPAGLALLTDYYVIYVDAGTIQLATSLKNAVEGTAVAFTNIGSGTHTLLGSVDGDPDSLGQSFLTGSNNSYRITWMSYGLLGPAADGAISLTGTKGYSTRISHRPRTVLYGVEATVSANDVTVAILPVKSF
jgi:hypothetical protein